MMTKVSLKFTSIFILFIVTLTSSGCFNYKDVNKALFTTTLILDYDDKEENVVVYLETFRPARGAAAGTEKGQRVLFKGKGKTLFEAVRDANLSSSYKINYTQNKAVIFTDKLVSRALKKVVDFIDRDQELIIRPYVFVYAGDPEALLKIDVKEEEYLGTYLFYLVQNAGSSSRAIVVTMNEYLSKRMMGSRSDVLTLLRIKKEQLEQKVELDGGAIIVRDKLQETLSRRETQGYNFLINEVKTGTLEVTNPFHDDSFVTLEIINSVTKTEIKYEKEKIKVIKNITVRTTFGETQQSFTMSEESMKKITQEAEDNIKKYSSKVYSDYKAKGIDIFEVQEDVYRHYPKLKMENPIEESELDIKVKVSIEGSSDKTHGG